ncbi:MAG: hypothetical protein R2820_11060 [Cyclobacteriaceae bacterium]
MADKSLVLIEIVHNGSPCLDEGFLADLESDYHLVQVRYRRLAAASEGGETWINLIINAPIVKFIALNVAWDLIEYGGKKLFLKPLLNALNRLAPQPNLPVKGLRLLKLKIQFDDTIIFIGGINGNFYSIIGSVFQKLSILMERFKDEGKLPITMIELPVERNESYDDKYPIDIFHDRVDTGFYLQQWKITYLDGALKKIYSFRTDDFLDC